MLFTTLAHGNSKNEIRLKTQGEGKKRRVNMKSSAAGTQKNRNINGLNIARAYHPPEVATFRSSG